MSSTNVKPPLPRPIAERICNCGCGHSFQPNRNDQIYLNKQHADYCYHHNVRKKKMKNQVTSEKYLRNNDRICRKYFESSEESEVICFFESLKADGFNFSFFLGSSTIKDIRYYHTYNYLLHLKEENGIKKVLIKKQ